MEPGRYSAAGIMAMSETKIVTHLHFVSSPRPDIYVQAPFEKCVLDYFSKDDMDKVYFDLFDSQLYLSPVGPVNRRAVRRQRRRWRLDEQARSETVSQISRKTTQAEDDMGEGPTAAGDDVEENAGESRGRAEDDVDPDGDGDDDDEKDEPPVWATEPVVLSHPPFCSFHHMTAVDSAKIAPEDLARGINVGIALILESNDQFVLLTRRAPHMRTFPNCWVPPGGHIDEGESLFEAALRELREETGLKLGSPSDLPLKVLGLREGAFPVALEKGIPRRHQMIVYAYCKVPFSRVDLNNQIKLNPEEVGGSTWLTKGMVQNIKNDRIKTGFRRENQAIMVNKNGRQWVETVDVWELLQERVGAFGAGRAAPGGYLSTGTKFALDLWLALKESEAED